MFQTLIGTVKSRERWEDATWVEAFQTLIGTVKRGILTALILRGLEVSNPHRYGQKSRYVVLHVGLS